MMGDTFKYTDRKMSMDMDYKDKYLRTFSENQKLKKQRNEYLDQIKRKNTEIERLSRKSGVPRTSSGGNGKGKTQPLSGTIVKAFCVGFFPTQAFIFSCNYIVVFPRPRPQRTELAD